MSDRQVLVTGVDDVVWNLTDKTSVVQADPDVIVWGTAPALVSAQNRVGVPGALVTGRRHGPRDIVIPLDVHPASTDLIESTLAQLARSTDAIRGDVTVTVIRADGTSRSIDGTVLAGLDALSMRTYRDRRVSPKLAIRCHHPYWRDTVPEVFEVVPVDGDWGGSGTSYDEASSYELLLPYDGVSPGGDSTSLSTTMVNPGDVAAWPTFVVTGPIDAVEAVNDTTGQSWRYVGDGLAAGEVLTIVTALGSQSVRIDGALALSALETPVDLWGLPPASSSAVTFRTPGRTSATEFTVTFSPEWLTC